MKHPRQAITIAKPIVALQIQNPKQDPMHSGHLSQLPPGARLRICGVGFNTRTVQVNWQGASYFVFRQDLGNPELHA